MLSLESCDQSQLTLIQRDFTFCALSHFAQTKRRIISYDHNIRLHGDIILMAI